MKDGLKKRFFQYRKRILLARGIKPANQFHIRQSRGSYYLYRYIPMNADTTGKEKQIRMQKDFWGFMNGDTRNKKRFYKLFYMYIKQFFWMMKIDHAEIAAIPGSHQEKDGVLSEMCRSFAKAQPFLLTYLEDGADLLVRTKDMKPIHSGARYMRDELKDTLLVNRKPTADTVILVDDMVHSGKTAVTCKELLYEAGAKKVYVLCLFAAHQK